MNDKNASRGCEGQLRCYFLAVEEHVTCWEKLRKASWRRWPRVSLVRSKEESLVRAAIRSRGWAVRASKAFIASKTGAALGKGWEQEQGSDTGSCQGVYVLSHRQKEATPRFPLVVWHDLILIFESVPRQQWVIEEKVLICVTAQVNYNPSTMALSCRVRVYF